MRNTARYYVVGDGTPLTVDVTYDWGGLRGTAIGTCPACSERILQYAPIDDDITIERIVIDPEDNDREIDLDTPDGSLAVGYFHQLLMEGHTWKGCENGECPHNGIPPIQREETEGFLASLDVPVDLLEIPAVRQALTEKAEEADLRLGNDLPTLGE